MGVILNYFVKIFTIRFRTLFTAQPCYTYTNINHKVLLCRSSSGVIYTIAVYVNNFYIITVGVTYNNLLLVLWSRPILIHFYPLLVSYILNNLSAHATHLVIKNPSHRWDVDLIINMIYYSQFNIIRVV